MSKKITSEEYRQWLKENRPEISLVGDYINANKKAEFECDKMHRWYSKPAHVKNGSGCPVCINLKKITKDDFLSWLLLNNPKISLCGDYLSFHHKVKFSCNEGHSWQTTPASIRNGSGCAHCAGNAKLTADDVNKSLEKANRNFRLIGNYVNNNTRTQFKCNDCNYEWNSTAANAKKRLLCPACRKRSRQLSESQFRDILKNKDNGITLVGEYVNLSTKTMFLCKNGHRWNTAPTHIKRGTGCPSCAEYGFNPNKPAWIYIFRRANYLKFGVTNYLEQRLHKHQMHGELELLFSHHFEDGNDALDWENIIKQRYGGKYVTSEQCPDGWTETLPLTLLDALLNHTQSLLSDLSCSRLE